MNGEKKFAVLIDSENISSNYINIIFDEISKEGTATYKRIYGDWTKNDSKWKKVLLEYSIVPIQQYSYTKGKNATDSAMIIDAMDILYSSNVDGFCLVSSDSDFTRLASRLRESGKTVIGMGESKTPKPFIAACEKFKFLDILLCAAENEDNCPDNQEEKIIPPLKQSAELQPIIKAIKTIVNETSDESGWLNAGTLGSILVKRFPEFDVRNFGFSKMTPFLESINTVETKRENLGNNGVQIVYVKNKKRRR
ncbi:MAG: NYN domain-containing protein [Spirochaetia bacterium]|nr:NYN domain-containing protein [Spirochaetia bacterium]